MACIKGNKESTFSFLWPCYTEESLYEEGALCLRQSAEEQLLFNGCSRLEHLNKLDSKLQKPNSEWDL